MNCPSCQNLMREREREMSGGQMVVIDVCPNCGGVYLDRGELETLTRAESQYYSSRNDGRQDDRRRNRDDDDDDDGGGFLGAIFGAFGGDRD
jgi:uncharacterized protein